MSYCGLNIKLATSEGHFRKKVCICNFAQKGISWHTEYAHHVKGAKKKLPEHCQGARKNLIKSRQRQHIKNT